MFFSLTAVCEPGDPSKISPELSEAGKDKIRRNIHVIDDNMDKINENLSTIEYNIGVLSKEIATLDGFRDEHLELKKRYETYLEEARKVKNKNDFSLTQLEEKHQAIQDKHKIPIMNIEHIWRSWAHLGQYNPMIR